MLHIPYPAGDLDPTSTFPGDDGQLQLPGPRREHTDSGPGPVFVKLHPGGVDSRTLRGLSSKVRSSGPEVEGPYLKT